MAKSVKTKDGFRQLKTDIEDDKIGGLYVFYGEEDYLKEYYLKQVEKKVLRGFEDFNLLRLEGNGVNRQSVSYAVDTLPFGEGQKLIVIRDFKLLTPGEDMKDYLLELFEDIPEHVCLIFYFDSVAFEPDKRLNLYKSLEKHGCLVEFQKAQSSDLIPWIKRRLRADNKEIDTADCEHMIFVCGYSMTNLVTEIEKLATGVPGKKITAEHIDNMCSRVLDAYVFDMTDRLLEGKYEGALSILRDLLDMKNEPAAICAVVTRQIQALYGARLASLKGRGEDYIAKLLGYRSSYPAVKIMRSAVKLDISGLRQAQETCLEYDLKIKSNLPDSGRTLELLILRLQSILSQ